jgi:hypothetical protein
MTARLSLLDEPQQSPWEEPQTHSDQTHSDQIHLDQRPVLGGHHLDDNSPWVSQQSNKHSAPQEMYLQAVQSNPYAPPIVLEPHKSPDGTEYAHVQDSQSYNPARLGSDAGIKTPSVALSNATSATSHELIDLDVPGAGGNLGARAAYRAGSSVYSEPTSKDAKPVSTPQPQPSPVLSAEEAARQKEQRSETYTIRHVRWTHKSGELIESPILVQNQNGPCPLLALINALVLRADPKTQPPIVRALSTREQISLGLLIEAMFEELITCLSPDEEFPDIEALTQFLTMLHTGMNVNPRLTLVSIPVLSQYIKDLPY